MVRVSSQANIGITALTKGAGTGVDIDHKDDLAHILRSQVYAHIDHLVVPCPSSGDVVPAVFNKSVGYGILLLIPDGLCNSFIGNRQAVAE